MSAPSFIVTTRNMAARVSGAATGWESWTARITPYGSVRRAVILRCPEAKSNRCRECLNPRVRTARSDCRRDLPAGSACRPARSPCDCGNGGPLFREPRSATRKIGDLQDHAIPAAGLLRLSVRHGARARCSRTAQDELEVAARDLGECRRPLVIQLEAERLGVEIDRAADVLDLVAHAPQAQHEASRRGFGMEPSSIQPVSHRTGGTARSSTTGSPLRQALSWRAMNALTMSRALSVCGPGLATHSCSAVLEHLVVALAAGRLVGRGELLLHRRAARCRRARPA